MAERIYHGCTITIEIARPYVARAVTRPEFDDGYGGPLGMLQGSWLAEVLPEAVRLAVDQYTIALTTAEDLHRDLERCLGTHEPLRVRNARGPRAPLRVHYVDVK